MNDTGPDTMTFTLNKTKAIWSTIATVGGGIALLLGGVSQFVDWRFEEKVKAAAKDPHSVLNMTLENLVEEELAELVQTVVEDDIEVLERDIERLERHVERLEGQ
jgi:hypothetical protein